jgi:putative glutamine amidotransferase
MKPLVGITTYAVDARWGVWDTPAALVPLVYVTAIERAGGRPLLVDAANRDHAPRQILQQVAGVVLPGGADIDPARYGEAPHPTFEASEIGRDEYETEIIRLALEQDVPMLAICRGIQILNVVLGGTLIQDIPSERPGSLNHRVTDPKWAIAHEVTVDAGSRLHALMRDRIGAGGALAVNSRHHQSIKDVARELRVTATSADGIIEAVERPGSTFCLGVQWHPENFVEQGAAFAPLFEAFIRAASAAATSTATATATADRASEPRPMK